MTPAKRPLLAVLTLLLAFPVTAQEPSRNIRFGLPSPAKADPKQREDYLMQRPQYTLSYNAKTRGPNWVEGKPWPGPLAPLWRPGRSLVLDPSWREMGLPA